MFTLFSHKFSFTVYFHYPEDLLSEDRKLTRFSLMAVLPLIMKREKKNGMEIFS